MSSLVSELMAYEILSSSILLMVSILMSSISFESYLKNSLVLSMEFFQLGLFLFSKH